MKLDILFHYEVNELTGEMKYIGKEEIKVDSAKKESKKESKKTEITDDIGIPSITLSDNKITLSPSAVTLLKVAVGDKVSIKYQTKNNNTIPVIGADKAFGIDGGNKLTKSYTFAFKGSRNEDLLEYGDKFTLEPSDHTDVYYLIGNKERIVNEVPEEIIDITQELEELNLLDDLSIEEDEIELDKYNFVL